MSPRSFASRRFRDLPLFWKVLAPFFALMLVLGTVGAFVIVRDLSTRAKTALDQDLIARSLDVESVLRGRELYLLESANFAANLEDMPQAVARGDRGNVSRLLQSVLALKSDLNVLAATDLTGRTIALFTRDRPQAVPEVRDATRLRSPFIERALLDRQGDKTSGLLKLGGRTMMTIVAPICAEATPCSPVGVAVVGIEADELATEALDALDLPDGPSYGIALFDASGDLIASRGDIPATVDAPAALSGPVAELSTTDGDERETLFTALELQGTRVGTVAVATKTAPALGSARATGIRLGVILLGAMAGIVAIGALLSRAILAQLRPLVATNRALGSGDLSARAPVLGRDELGEVAQGVNQMADQLQANIETLESRVEQRTQEVRRLLRERTEFFAGLSHELRTPLAIILSQSQMLRDPTFRKTRDALEELGCTIGDSAEQLLGLVNEILELARAELGGIELNLEELKVDDMLRHLRGTVGGLASAADLKLTVAPAPQRLPRVRADRERLRQILLNLVDNAVKYTPPGGTVEVAAHSRNGDVSISVRDSGVGIPDEIGESIFEPFFRVPGTKPQRGQASSGLGLALTKRLVEAHGGALWYESEAGRGTTFTLTLPKAVAGRRRARV